MTRGLRVADPEVLDLAVADIAARHDVELSHNAPGHVPGLDLALAVVDLLEPGVDGVAGEVAAEVAVPAERAADVVVELSVDAEVERLARTRLAHGERSTGLEPLLGQHGGREPDVGQACHNRRRTVEVRGAGDGGHDGGGHVLDTPPEGLAASFSLTSDVMRAFSCPLNAASVSMPVGSSLEAAMEVRATQPTRASAATASTTARREERGCRATGASGMEPYVAATIL
eukprot:CAMPEP_0173389876 /NCGR_PEP_ID=MMETSP1356-20130122/13806_1 /TAXON_ID=77927 ORGANISM="Hemiselmis virescens, Strain PCC157" /NCGR_SAMPLE_ID=MMETSP1356 /ASSEMBLY_ACC=CAM_ASM_000847 /LENGTH=228 /DNA_ID=CAMNT_0014347147 /DNA_START=139 /DNA_END=826 /DNA_ORIENTATION=+